MQHVVRVHEILAHFICSCNLPLHKPQPRQSREQKQLAYRDAGTREENSIAMTHHHPDLSSPSHRLKLSTNEKHYPDLGSDASSVWNFCSCSSDVISRGNKTKKWWCHENSKTRLPLFFPTRLTAPGSPGMEIKTKRTKRWKRSVYFKFTGKGGPSTHFSKGHT